MCDTTLRQNLNIVRVLCPFSINSEEHTEKNKAVFVEHCLQNTFYINLFLLNGVFSKIFTKKMWPLCYEGNCSSPYFLPLQITI